MFVRFIRLKVIGYKDNSSKSSFIVIVQSLSFLVSQLPTVPSLARRQRYEKEIIFVFLPIEKKAI